VGVVFGGAFLGGVLGLILGVAFGVLGGGGLHPNREFFTALAALVGLARSRATNSRQVV
jgi:hypothetical protein